MELISQHQRHRGAAERRQRAAHLLRSSAQTEVAQTPCGGKGKIGGERVYVARRCSQTAESSSEHPTRAASLVDDERAAVDQGSDEEDRTTRKVASVSRIPRHSGARTEGPRQERAPASDRKVDDHHAAGGSGTVVVALRMPQGGSLVRRKHRVVQDPGHHGATSCGRDA